MNTKTNDDDLLDALREEWAEYGKRLDRALDNCPPVKLNFRPVRRKLAHLSTVLVAVWLLLMAVSAVKVPESEGHHMAGMLASRPDEAVVCVESILLAV
jgi:hypothetical protein